MNFQRMGCGRFWRGVSLNIEASLENLGRRSIYRELRETGRVFRKWCISIYGSFVRGTWRRKEGSGDGHLFPWEHR
jgi:hypothetical protein